MKFGIWILFHVGVIILSIAESRVVVPESSIDVGSLAEIELPSLSKDPEEFANESLSEELYQSQNWDLENQTDYLYRSDECRIAVNGRDLPNPQPIFIVPGTEQLFTPSPKGEIRLPYGSAIELGCTDFFAKPFSNQKLLTASCNGGKAFNVEGRVVNLKDLKCNKPNYHIPKRTGQSCSENGILVDVGFQFYDRFLTTYTACHDEVQETTLYVHHKLNPASVNFQKFVTRPNFIQSDFFKGKKVQKLYTKKVQMETIGTILNGAHERYFDDNKSFYLARGHLTAKTDHIFGPEQTSTFYFINAAPQWQRFNAGNWEKVETGVRQFVARKKIEVDCYTGTWGVSELPNDRDEMQKLYLHMDENNNGQIPVPMLYYRVVIEPATERGIVLIGVNNPHLSLHQIEEDYVICDDVSDKINWLNWKKDDISSGYSYACDVNDFVKVVHNLPKFNVKKLLY